MPYNREINDRWTFRTADTKEFTHGYHVYPAMMIPQIARALIDEYAPEGRLSKIFDPYVGSGTTLVEASVKGIESIGTDLNPLARLMSKVKTTHYDESQILNITQ
jgi:tRNA G10  N-methylase Trm11